MATATRSAATTSSFTPLHDRILVRRLEEGETVRGGIIIPDTPRKSPRKAKSSPSAKASPTMKAKSSPSTSSRRPILFGKYCGTEIKIDGEDFLIMKEDEVLGILKGSSSPIYFNGCPILSETQGWIQIKYQAHQEKSWQSKSCTVKTPVRQSCAASILSPTLSR